MDMNSLRNIDLNLLVVLDALLSEKHVTRTASRLHLSQPAVSHSLGKLRALLDDPLLIRQGGRVTLSAKAEALKAPLKDVLSRVEGLLGQPNGFDPASSQRTFHLAMSDYGASFVLSKLLRRVRRLAPDINLVVTQDSRSGMLEQIAQGKVDLALGVFPSLPVDVCVEVLFEETFSCLLDRSTLPAGARLDLERYLARPHLSVSVDGAASAEVDRVLRLSGLQRRIAVSLPHWLAAPDLIAQTDLILTVATRILRGALKDPALILLEPPFAIPPFPFVHIWHSRFSDDPAHQWIRQQVKLAAVHDAAEP
ncbi:LysR family transcriptional regulator [Pseudomonas sp. MBLB4123]|uniref:LysR family transcriptional regulator n=1 Tax=Pseudomonas sp. MBLB4123 TaxID=3451557 RepID=UPI003F7512D4